MNLDDMPKKKWLIESLHNFEYSFDWELEQYLNSDPHPDYELFNVTFRTTTGNFSDSVAALIWKLVL